MESDNAIPLVREKYYAVYYTDPMAYYIGRIVNLYCTCHVLPSCHLSMIFLRKDYFTNKFFWPKSKHTYECVPKQFVFEGHLELEGTGPFTVQNLSGIEKKFKNLKKN